uniref:Alpha-macroglobulin receptor-binding domain-containing protein n=1 Tax=Chelonoidis abingdonii TaxID=106734 RepID=A0A8C0IKZ8_CHEAB
FPTFPGVVESGFSPVVADGRLHLQALGSISGLWAMSFTFFLEHDFPVKNLKAAPVRLYDYYGTGKHTQAEYSAPCSSAPDASTMGNSQ